MSGQWDQEKESVKREVERKRQFESRQSVAHDKPGQSNMGGAERSDP